MAGTASARIQLLFNLLTEYTEAELPGIGASSIAHAAFNGQWNLDPTVTAQPVTYVYAEKLTSSQTLDLTALARTLEATINATGLKIQAILLNNLSTANTVLIDDNAANENQINAGADVTIQPESSLAMVFKDKLADVDATHKLVTFTATAGQSYEVALALG